MVVAYTLEFAVFSVQVETFVGNVFNAADTEAGDVGYAGNEGGGPGLLKEPEDPYYPVSAEGLSFAGAGESLSGDGGTGRDGGDY